MTHTHRIRETPLAGAIRSMRKRLHLGQVRFTMLVLDKYVTGAISRWERGRSVPEIKNLLRLLRLAETPEETAAILQALKAQGIDDLLANVQPYLTSSPGKAFTTPPNSIAPVIEGSNV